MAAPNILNPLAIGGMNTVRRAVCWLLGAEGLAGVWLVFSFVIPMQHMAAGGMGGGVSSAIVRAHQPRSVSDASVIDPPSFLTMRENPKKHAAENRRHARGIAVDRVRTKAKEK
jgi:hypothetical protein